MRLSLYIHYPFCVRKCLYCDFNSSSDRSLPPSEYAALVVKELELRRALLSEDTTVPTIYFGGGTPSLMDPPLVGQILDAAAGLFNLDADTEITLEANPGTVDEERLRGYRTAGVNRLSLGVQSLEDRLLKRLGRVHTVREALEAYDAARRAGFDNISIDLMHSLPEQSVHEWLQALQRAIALAPEHISAYALSVEEGTPFEALLDRDALPLPDEEDAARMFELTAQTLEAAGYRHYEISNFAREGRESRHNGIYWSRGSYFGLGAGAHSFLNDTRGVGRRWKNPDGVEEYRLCISKGEPAYEEAHDLSLREAVSESFFLGLRRLCGVDLAPLQATYGSDILHDFIDQADRLVAEGLLLKEGSTLRLAPSAVIVANRVFSSFL